MWIPEFMIVAIGLGLLVAAGVQAHESGALFAADRPKKKPSRLRPVLAWLAVIGVCFLIGSFRHW